MHYLLTILGPVLALSVYALTTGQWSLIAVLVLNAVFSGWGISVGFHKVFSHKTHQPRSIIQLLLLAAGTAAGQGSSIQWRSAHDRYHHMGVQNRRSQSPTSIERLGKWYYLLSSRLVPSKTTEETLCREHKSPICAWHVRIDRSYLQWFYGIGVTLSLVIALLSFYAGLLDSRIMEYFAVLSAADLPQPSLAVLFQIVGSSIAYGIGSWSLAVSLTIAQTMVAVMLGYKPIHEWPNWMRPWFVNRPYITNDDSVNLPVLAWFTWGQALCNNHEARPHRYSFKMKSSEAEREGTKRWYEDDPTSVLEPMLRLFRSERRSKKRQGRS